MLEIHYSEKAADFLTKLNKKNKKDSRLIVSKIEAYARDPQSVHIVPVVTTPYYRIKAGNYRIIIDRKWNIVDIIEIGGRGYIYRGY